jgi:hypothetical protein
MRNASIENLIVLLYMDHLLTKHRQFRTLFSTKVRQYRTLRVCLVSWPISRLVRILDWAALACSHQANPWLFGCLYYVSLASLRMCLVVWFVLIQTPSLVR